jgi:LuxR family maltose regulon positive regulatory protein
VDLHGALSLAEAKSLNRDHAGLLEAKLAAELAMEIARRLNRGADLMHARLLWARSLSSLGQPVSERDKEEMLDQCRVVGLHRLLRQAGFGMSGDTHSQAGQKMAIVHAASPEILEDRSFLTVREREILQQLSTRMSNKEIAISMGVGEETVKWHLKNLFRKLEAGDRRGVVSRARSLGLI